FDGLPEKLAYLLNYVWIYLGHGAAFPDKGACVNPIAANLEEAAEWMVALYDDEALELGNIDAFLEGLQVRFGYPTEAHRVEAEILAGKLRGWPERLLVYQVRDGLSREVYQNCLPRGIPDDLHAWYQLATTVEVDLMEY
ncbi:hypothetical protein NXF25_018972, partial [Crotalus adamanteus]